MEFVRAGEPSRPQTLCSGRAHLNRLTAKFRALALALRRDAAEKRLLRLREKLAFPSAGVSLAYPKIVSSSLLEEGRLNYGTSHIILSGLRQKEDFINVGIADVSLSNISYAPFVLLCPVPETLSSEVAAGFF